MELRRGSVVFTKRPVLIPGRLGYLFGGVVTVLGAVTEVFSRHGKGGEQKWDLVHSFKLSRRIDFVDIALFDRSLCPLHWHFLFRALSFPFTSRLGP